MASSLISQFRKHFKAEAHEEGLQTGLQTGRLTILSKQIEARLGAQSERFLTDLPKLNLAKQDELASALVTIRSKKELLKKLATLFASIAASTQSDQVSDSAQEILKEI